MDKIHDFEKEKNISFSNRTELILFVSNYLALQYKNYLEFWSTTAIDDEEEFDYWKKRIEREVPRLKKAVKRLLKWKLIFKNKLSIKNTSLILKIAFKMARIKKSNPENCFPINLEYGIDDLTFF